MKYIISESRLDKVIIGFIESQLEPYEIKKIKFLKGEFWIKNHIVLGVIRKNVFYLNEKTFFLIKEMFSLESSQVMQYVIQYLKNKGFNISTIDWFDFIVLQNHYNRDTNLL